MKLLAFSIYDSKVEMFIQPFFDVTKGSAIRNFSDAVNDNTTAFNKHPEDYTLFHVGIFDQELGRFQKMEPDSLGTAITFIVASINDLREGYKNLKLEEDYNA